TALVMHRRSHETLVDKLPNHFGSIRIISDVLEDHHGQAWPQEA
ncbi:MAG: hypothetical protein QOK45_1841, partial [Mycobacterium sp.]|nr:hypothetical protein [Mycobacterium sp.]